MTEKSDNPLLKAALAYHKRGWSIIPIVVWTPRGCKKSKKVPPKGVEWLEYQTRQPEESELREWFGEHKYKNLAVVCGAVSGGVTVLDLDSRERYEWWCREHPELAGLPTVRTKMGMHIYFRAEPFPKQNGDDVDLLCEGAYVVLPPSMNKEWITPLGGELPLLDPFEWGLEQFGISRPTTSTQHFTEETEDTKEIEDIEASVGERGVKEIAYRSLANGPKKAVDDAIENTLPSKEGQRNWRIFQFCRWLKGMVTFSELPAVALKSIAREWHRRALPKIGTKPFDETWADFTHAWPRVKYPKGDSAILKLATERALTAKTPLNAEKEYDSEETRLLIRVCYELQKLRGSEPFWISCRDAAGILGLSHTEANKRIQMLVADDVLRLVQKNTTKKACRYCYVVG